MSTRDEALRIANDEVSPNFRIEYNKFTADYKHYSRLPFKLYDKFGYLKGSFGSISAAIDKAKGK